jgi:hypothetical protein
MPNLIDSSFFVGDINIPNTSKPEVAESLNLFIAKHETELLKQLFGYELWKSYNTDATTPRFFSLINGEDDWRGLVYNISLDVKGSLIAYYVYWFWMKDKQIWNSGYGTVRPKGDQTEVMPVYLKLMEAWNTFSKQACEFISYIGNNKDIYPEWSPINLWEFNTINDFDI